MRATPRPVSAPASRRSRPNVLAPLALAAGLLVTGLTALVLPAAAGAVPPAPAATPLVPITDTSFQLGPTSATVDATVSWNGPAAKGGVTVGTVRVVAVSATTHLPDLVASTTTDGIVAGDTIVYHFTITSSSALQSLASGNRVVVTATQHGPVFPNFFTNESLITVDQLQAGPSRGPVGSKDCSDRAYAPVIAPANYEACDFTGAYLSGAMISSDRSVTDLQQADLTGAVMVGSSLVGANLRGSSLAGVDASGSTFQSSTTSGAFAADFVDHSSFLTNDELFATNFTGANFSGSTFGGTNATTFAASDLDGASFAGDTITNVEFRYLSAIGSNFSSITARDSVFSFVNFTRATLEHASILGDASYPHTDTLCHTILPDGSESNRDC